MVTKRFTGRAYALLWYGVVSTIIVAAVVMSLARVLLPLADEYRGRVEQWVSAQLGQPVRIVGMNARLLGTSPTLIFSGVQLLEDSDSAARFEELHFGFDLLASARNAQPVLDRVVIRGANLALERLRNGQFRVRGLALEGGPADSEQAPVALGALLSSQPTVVIRDSTITWQDHRRGGHAFTFEGVEIELNNRGERHRLNAEFELPKKLGGAVQLAVDLEGNLFRPDLGRGTLHVNARQWRPGPWLKALPDAKWSILRGEVDVALWTHWDARAITSISGSVAGKKLEFSGAAGDVAVEQLAAKGSWRQVDGGWRLEIANLDMQRPDSRWQGARIQAFGSADGETLRVKANRIDVGDAVIFARSWPELAPGHRRVLTQAAPRGELSDLRISREGEKLSLQAQATDLAMEPLGRLPGFSGLDGQVAFQDGRGQVEFATRDATVKLPRLFRYPLDLQQLDGQVLFSREGERWHLASQKLQIANPDISAAVAVVAEAGPGESPFIDLQARFRDARAERVRSYLPVGIMPDETVQWLDRAFRSGRVDQGSLLFHGRAADFPFENGNGRFQVRFDARDVTLDYKPDWPLVQRLSGEVSFEGAQLQVHAERGRILDSKVQQAHARIANLKKAVLEIDGTVEGPFADLIDYVRESGLGETHSAALGRFSGGGESRLGLKLRQPLDQTITAPGYVRGEVELRKARLQVADAVAFDDLEGRLDFDGVRVSSRQIEGKLLGEPVRMSVYTEGKGETVTSLVAFQGMLEGRQLAKLGTSPLLKRFRGRTGWQGTLTLPHEGTASGAIFHFSSALQGLGTDLPAPLNKALETGERLRGAFWLGQGRGEVVWEQRLGLSFELAEGARLRRAALAFGDTAPALPGDDIIRLTGSVDNLSLSAWQELFGTDAEDGPSAALPAIRADLDRVRVVQDAAGQRHTETSGSVPLPALDVQINSLTYEDMDLGRVKFQGRPRPDAFVLRNLVMDGRNLQVRGAGRWDFAKPGGSSALSLEFSSGNLGAATRDLRVASVIQKGAGTARLELTWPGGPGDFELARLNGRMRVDLKDGVIEEVDPGAGRLLGLLSLQALPRRLILDFSDLFEKGVRFQDIKGNIRLVDGHAYTENLRLDSLPASVLITGRTGLGDRDYDQLVTVVPQVSGTLPLAGGLALGPQVGAVLLVFQQLFGDRIDEGAQFQYSVKGSWDDPAIERLELPRS